MGFETRVIIDTEKSRKQTFFDVEANELFINEMRHYCIKISDCDAGNNAFDISISEAVCVHNDSVIERIPSAEQKLFTLTLRKN